MVAKIIGDLTQTPGICANSGMADINNTKPHLQIPGALRSAAGRKESAARGNLLMLGERLRLLRAGAATKM